MYSVYTYAIKLLIMILKPPISGSDNARDIAALAHSPAGRALIAWLEEARLAHLEMLPQILEAPRLHQMQGAAAVLKELVYILKRTP